MSRDPASPESLLVVSPQSAGSLPTREEGRGSASEVVLDGEQMVTKEKVTFLSLYLV